MADLEGIDDHPFQETEREFFEAIAVLFKHLSERALKAEAEVLRLRTELDHRREQVEYYERPKISLVK